MSSQHLQVLRDFWYTRALRVPMLLIWIAAFGGALHAPCTAYFLTALGASPTDIGNMGMLIGLGELLMAPLYGWVLDKVSPFHAIVATGGFCTIGCIVRGATPNLAGAYVGAGLVGLGAANLWTVVLTYASSVLPASRRSAVVAGFSLQVLVLNIVGKAAYTPCVYALAAAGVDDDLSRWRVMMCTCPLFCVFGWVALPLCGRAVPRGPLGADGRVSAADPTEEVAAAEEGASAKPAPSSGGGGGDARPVLFSVCAACIFLAAYAKASISVLWPLYLRDAYAYADAEYSALLLTQNVLTAAAVAALPSLSTRLGAAALAPPLCALAAATSLAVFNDAAPRRHAAYAIVFFAAHAMLFATLQALGSLLVPAAAQGRAFATLAMLASLGDVAGNGAATRLYAHAHTPYIASALPRPLSVRSVPALAAAALLAAATLALACARAHFAEAMVDAAGSTGARGRASPPNSPRLHAQVGVAEEREGLLQRRRLVT